MGLVRVTRKTLRPVRVTARLWGQLGSPQDTRAGEGHCKDTGAGEGHRKTFGPSKGLRKTAELVRVTARECGWRGSKQNTGVGEGHHKDIGSGESHCKAVGPVVRITLMTLGSLRFTEKHCSEGHWKALEMVRDDGRFDFEDTGMTC